VTAPAAAFDVSLRLEVAPMKPRIGIREIALRLTLVAGGILFALVLSELVFRAFPDLLPEGARLRIHWAEKRSPEQFAECPYIGFTPTPEPNGANDRDEKPGAKRIWGHRNNEPWPERADILAIGDSFTYSQTVSIEEAWTSILDRSLPGHRTLTLGLVGGAPQQYLRIYETYGVDLDPRVLLVGLFPANDLYDAARFDRWIKNGRRDSYIEFRNPHLRPGLRGCCARLARQSRVITLWREFMKTIREGRLFTGKTIDLPSGESLQLVPRCLRKAENRARPERPEIGLVLDTVVETCRLAREHGAEPLVLVFPSKEEVYLPLLGEEATGLAKAITTELEACGLPYLDLGPAFRERAGEGEALFREVDGHPNAHGYALIAETVLDHIREHAGLYGLAI
jgi:hypothetical protein